MTKRAIISLLAAFASFSICAQNEHIHIFRNDAERLSTVKATDIRAITHTNGSSEYGFQTMQITDYNSNNTTIDLNLIDSIQTRQVGLPEFHITLQDYPEWNELQGAKDDIHPATLRMNGNGWFEDIPEQTVEFRGRGNTTWGMNKKPYRFKMNKKASVCGLPKAKSFVLLANYIDCTLMRNAIAFWIANYLEMPYSNHSVPVRVYLNGIDKGAYLLTEKLGIGSGSVDIDENTGILFELDANYDEDYKFKYTWTYEPYGDFTMPVMIKDPDLTEISIPGGLSIDEYFKKWQEDFGQMIEGVSDTPADGDLKPWLNLESVANFYIVNSFCGNHELYWPKSFFMYKKSLDENEVYHFGPVWDFDWAFTFNKTEGAPANTPLLSGGAGGAFADEIFRNEEFRTIYKAKWDKFIEEGYPQLQAWMEEYTYLIEPQAIENGKIWPEDRTYSTMEFRKNFEDLKTWIEARIEYCNSHPNFGIVPY